MRAFKRLPQFPGDVEAIEVWQATIEQAGRCRR
jgi:hypothetical protein